MPMCHPILLLVFVTCFINIVKCNFGPYIKPTSGAIWPKPQEQQELEGYFIFDRTQFDFQITNKSCPDLIDTLDRYKDIIVNTSFLEEPIFDEGYNVNIFLGDPRFMGHLDEINVSLNGPCKEREYPTLGMNEEYVLKITQEAATLSADTIWGIYRGLETFSQIIHVDKDGMTLIVNATNIHDYPRFPFRGLLLDTARHFQSIDDIKKTLDAMSYSKMNVFHWHLTDDESFPYQSAGFPEMSMFGAFHKRLQYSMTEIRDAIEYARKRGIIVIPEFDTPGHTASWGLAKPELLSTCYKDGEATEDRVTLDPTRMSTYQFMDAFLQEIIETFPAEYLHLGGDSVDYTCWKNNPEIADFMKKMNVTDNFDKLLNIYMETLLKLVGHRKKAMVWEEVFSNNASLSASTIVHVWKSLTWPETLQQATLAGQQAVLSSCWVPDEVMGAGDWVIFYMCDPVDETLLPSQQRLVRGGCVAARTHTVNAFNLDERLWPKAAAAGERLWSRPLSILDMRDIARRLEEHTCRMNRRGVRAKPPNGPSVCF